MGHGTTHEEDTPGVRTSTDAGAREEGPGLGTAVKQRMDEVAINGTAPGRGWSRALVPTCPTGPLCQLQEGMASQGAVQWRCAPAGIQLNIGTAQMQHLSYYF